MGNSENNYFQSQINEKTINEFLGDDKIANIEKIFKRYTNIKRDYLIKENFNRIIKLEDVKLSDELFEIFGDSKGKMYFFELKKFYSLFANKKWKNILLSFLLIGKQDKIEKIVYLENLDKFIKLDKHFEILKNEYVLGKIIYEGTQKISDYDIKKNKLNDKVDYIHKSSLLTVLSGKINDEKYKKNKNKNKENANDKDNQIDEIKKSIKKLKISFFEKIKPSSEFLEKQNNEIKNNEDKNKKGENEDDKNKRENNEDKSKKKNNGQKIDFEKHFVCDCFNKEKNNDLKFLYLIEKEETSFLNYQHLFEKGHISFNNFEKLMMEYRMNNDIIALMHKYFEKKTMKNSIILRDFTNLMSELASAKSHKTEKFFLFEIILTIHNQNKSVTNTQLKQFFNIEKEEIKLNDDIDKDEFENLNENIIQNKINEYINKMKNLFLLPYIRYNLEVDNFKLKKEIINYILNGKSVEKYIIDNFDKNEEFYPINKSFIDSLINKENQNEEKINNSLISIEDEIYNQKCEEKSEEKNKCTKNVSRTEKQDNNSNKNEKKSDTKKINNSEKQESNENNKKEKEKNKNIKEKENEEKNIVENTSMKKEEKKEPIIGKLIKDNNKYGDKFYIICGELYKKISHYFEFDKLIKLQKTIIESVEVNQINEKEKKAKNTKEKIEEKNDNTNKITEKVIEKSNEQTESNNKDDKIINLDKNEEKEIKVKNLEDDKTERKGLEPEKNKEKDIKSDDSEEISNHKNQNKEDRNEKQEKIINGLKEERKIKENSEDVKNDNILDKVQNQFRIMEKGENDEMTNNILYIDKEKKCLRKKEEKNNLIKEYIVDFNPVKYIQIDFDEVINKIEEEKYNQMAKKEKVKLINDKKKKDKIKENKKIEYEQKIERIKQLFKQKILSKEEMVEKKNNLKKQYKELFNKTISITISEFMKYLKDILYNIISEKKKEIKIISRDMPLEEFKNNLKKYNDDLNNEKFNLIYFTNKKPYIHKDKNFINDTDEDFILIIIDKEDGLSILEENEKIKKNKNIKKEEKQKKSSDVLSEEDLKKRMNDKKLKDEKLKKQKEKEEKEKLAKIKLEQKKVKEKLIQPPYGIPNFGNTCYFNSVNQIILNLPVIQKIFNSNNIKYMINKENKFGYKGKLISSFLPLYEIYRYQIEDNFRNLKATVGKLNEAFNNTQQQDAHEYLNFILEGLHEELNLKSSKIYIVDNDDNYSYNSEDELGNIAWANNLRRNISFIDSIFMLQLKSNLTCKKCGTKKVNFETSYVFNMPLSLCKMVTVHINLYRLPFNFKVYYEKKNKDFKDFKEKETNKEKKKINEILIDYYSNKLTFEQRNEHAVNVSFEFDYEREKSIGDLIKLLRSLPLLELEDPDKKENDNKEIKVFGIKQYTELIAYFGNSNKIIENNMLIDQFVDVNDRTQLNIYEVLNANGYALVNENYMKEQKFNLFSFPFNEKKVSEELKKISQNKNYLNEDKERHKFPENDDQNKKLNYILSITDTLLYKDKIKSIQDDDKNSSNESEGGAKKSETKKNQQNSKNKTTDANNTLIKDSNISPRDNINSQNKEMNSKDDKNSSTKTQKNPKDDTNNSSNVIKENDNTDLTNNLNISKNFNNQKCQEQGKPPNSSEDSEVIEKQTSINIANNEQKEDKNRKNEKINTKNNIIYEFIIPIVHFRADHSDTPSTVFLDFNYKKVNYFPLQLLILNNNNSNKLSSLDLYNYIWNYNLLYMNHPLKKTDKFWFNIKKEQYLKEKNYKICYPFVIRIVKQNKIYPLTYKCSKCRWYNFCCGCVLSPYEENVKFESDDIIFVDWCNQLIEEEIDSENFDCKSISNEDIMSNINLALKDDKDNNIQSIDDCLNLFFSPEDLEDPLSCRKCNGPQNFSKNYEINKLPYVLVLALKRFKYNENKNFKLKQLITYPIDDYKIKDKIYDLFGVIYHYGGINSGHYTCAVRKGNKWKLCDDNRISDIDTNKVMNSNAYILFYISKDNINTFSYYNCMRSLLLHMTAEKLKNTHNLKDNNFFKGEPIRYKNKDIGYVVEDSIEDFNDKFIIKNKKEENDEDKNIPKENEKDKEEIKVAENKDNNQKENKDNAQNVNMKGKVKVKLENKKEEQIVDKKDIEKLILIDEQKKDNKK